MLSQNSYGDVTTAKNGGEARRLLIERDFDLCIINAPLVDEFGEEFARNIVSTGIGQAILIVKSEIYDEVSEKVEADGIITIAKPMNRVIFWSALKLVNATYNKMYKLKGKIISYCKRLKILE